MSENNLPQKKKELQPWQKALTKAQDKISIIVDDKEKVAKELGFALQVVQESESLRKCTPASIQNAVVNIARTGLTINPVLQLAYLVPRKGKCTLDISYRGMVKILKDSGAIKHIDAYIVYSDEVFQENVAEGTLKHEIRHAETEAEQKKRKKIGAYTRTILPDGQVIFSQLMPDWEIQKIKKTSQSANSSYSPWQNWEEEMYKKTAIKRAFKTLISDYAVNHPNVNAATEAESEIEDIEYSQKTSKDKMSKIFDISDQMTDAEIVDDEPKKEAPKNPKDTQQTIM